MCDDPPAARSDADAELEREIRRGRKFTLEEAIARLAGPGALKGQSPVPRLQQAAFEIESWLGTHLADTGAALKGVLLRRVTGSELLLANFDQPLIVLASYCQNVLASDYLLADLVREADVQWGHALGERPYFQREGAPSHPDDPYTVDSIRTTLSQLLEQLRSHAGTDS